MSEPCEGYSAAAYVRFLLSMDRGPRLKWRTETDAERSRLMALDQADFEKTGVRGTRTHDWTLQFFRDAVRIGRENMLEARIDQLTAAIRKLLPEDDL